MRDAIERGSDVWFDPEFSQERKHTVKWAVEGYHGERPDMVLRVMDELGCLKQDALCLIWLLNNLELLKILKSSAGSSELPFTAIRVWVDANWLYRQRQKLDNLVSRIDKMIMHGYCRSDNTHVDGLIGKLGPFEAFAGYYMVTHGGGEDTLLKKMTEVQIATGWIMEKTDDVAQFAYLEAYMWAKTGADVFFQRVLENH
ncbi:MAG: hypothetical protein ACYCS8_00690 [Acidithiobacillus sp.]